MVSFRNHIIGVMVSFRNHIVGVMVSFRNHIVGVMISLGICCFSTIFRITSKNKDWLARNQDNMSEWSDMSISISRQTVVPVS
jgi:hypothetical protein